MKADTPAQPSEEDVPSHQRAPRRVPWLWLAALAGLALTFSLDPPVLAWTFLFRETEAAAWLRRTVRWLGTGHVQAVLLLLLLAWGVRKERRAAQAAGLWGLASLAVSGLAVNALKILVHRPRPFADVSPTDWWTGLAQSFSDGSLRAFPSAETATTFAVLAMVCVFLPRARGALITLGVLVGVARVLVGAHHPSDVWAGAMLGVFVAQALTPRARRWEASGAPVMTERVRHALPALGLAAYTVTVFFLGLGRLPLFGRDETWYAEAAREMYASGDWILPRLNGVLFLEKPPLNYWLAGASYHLFGVSPLAARVPAALLGVVTVLLVTYVGARVWGRRAGLWAGFVLASCLQVAFIGRMGIMDVPLMSFTALALLSYVRWRRRGELRYALAFGALVGLAVLLKSLAGFLPALVVLLHAAIFRRPRLHAWVLPAIAAIAVAAVIAVPWFLAVGAREPSFWPTFLEENFGRMGHAKQGHAGNLLYYPALILFGSFPWVMFLPAAFRRGLGAGETKHLWRSLCAVWFTVVLVFFMLLSTKLPGYIVPLYPAMALLVGREVDRRLEEPGRAPWVAAFVGALVLAAVAAMLPAIGAKVGARVGAAAQARQLVVPAIVWAAALAAIGVGALLGAVGRRRSGVGVMLGGQTVALAAVFVGILPLLIPFQEGSREMRLAEIAGREMPGVPVVLHETRPEAVAFVLGRTVPVYGGSQDAELLRQHPGRIALMAPVGDGLLKMIPLRRTWVVGNGVLVDVPSDRPLAEGLWRCLPARTSVPPGDVERVGRRTRAR